MGNRLPLPWQDKNHILLDHMRSLSRSDGETLANTCMQRRNQNFSNFKKIFITISETLPIASEVRPLCRQPRLSHSQWISPPPQPSPGFAFLLFANLFLLWRVLRKISPSSKVFIGHLEIYFALKSLEQGARNCSIHHPGWENME